MKAPDLLLNELPELQNELVLLRPLQESDYDQLLLAASDPAIWEQHPIKNRSTPEGFSAFFREAMQTGTAYAIVNKLTNEIIGSSRYYPCPDSDNVVEIGWTFLSRQYWGGRYNNAIKYLMLEYAFRFVDTVVFHVNQNNFRSQKAVEKIGGSRIATIDGKPVSKRTNDSFVFALSKEVFSTSFRG